MGIGAQINHQPPSKKNALCRDIRHKGRARAWAHPGAAYEEAGDHRARQRQEHAAHGEERSVQVDALGDRKIGFRQQEHAAHREKRGVLVDALGARKLGCRRQEHAAHRQEQGVQVDARGARI